MRLQAVELLKKRGVLISPDDGGTIEHLRKITPGRTSTLDPQYTFNEHPVVAPGRTLLVGPTYNQWRHPLPRRVAQNRTVHHTKDGLPKRSLESCQLAASEMSICAYSAKVIVRTVNCVDRGFQLHQLACCVADTSTDG